MNVLIKASDLPKSDIEIDKLKNVLSYLNELILRVNKKGGKSLKTHGENGEFGGDELYCHITPFVKSVIDELKEAGYKAEISSNNVSGIHLLIEW